MTYNKDIRIPQHDDANTQAHSHEQLKYTETDVTLQNTAQYSSAQQ